MRERGRTRCWCWVERKRRKKRMVGVSARVERKRRSEINYIVRLGLEGLDLDCNFFQKPGSVGLDPKLKPNS